MKRMVILGAGTAGLSAVAAAVRVRDAVGQEAEPIEIAVVAREKCCGFTVYNYQGELVTVDLALAELLHPLGVIGLGAEVAGIDANARQLELRDGAATSRFAYDTLVLARDDANSRAAASALLPALARDSSGRLPVDTELRVRGLQALFAAEAATAGMHDADLGALAGENAARELYGKPLLRLWIDPWIRYPGFGVWGA